MSPFSICGYVTLLVDMMPYAEMTVGAAATGGHEGYNGRAVLEESGGRGGSKASAKEKLACFCYRQVVKWRR